MGFFSLAIASSFTRKPIFDGWDMIRAGNTARVVPRSFGGTGAIPMASTADGLAGIKSGAVALQQAGKGVDVVGYGRVPLGDTGKGVQALAKAPISRAAFLRGVAATLSGPAAWVALAAAAPAVIDWLGASKIQNNPNEADYPHRPFLMPSSFDGFSYRIQTNIVTTYWTSAQNACGIYAERLTAYYHGIGETSINLTGVASGSGNTAFCALLNNGNGWSGTALQFREETAIELLPASLDDIAPYLDKPEAPALTPQIVEQGVTKAGIDPFGGESPKVTVTGPVSVPGQKTQTSTQVQVLPGTTTIAPPGTATTQPATQTATSTATHNVTYNDNRVSYTTTTVTTTTITNNVTGDSTTTPGSTTETEDDSTKEEEPDICEKNPDSLMCQKPDLDVPDGDIPKATRNVDYQPEDLFGGGSCPANKTMTTHGQQITVWDWGQSCSYIQSYMRPVILVLCAFAAFIIVSGGAKQ